MPRRTPQRVAILVEGVRAAILDGRLPVGGLLPPSNDVAKALGLESVNVENAYALLRDEGHLATEGRVGTPDGVRTWVAIGPDFLEGGQVSSAGLRRLLGDRSFGTAGLPQSGPDLFRALRKAIRSRMLRVDWRLPSTRDLAMELGSSAPTVSRAYRRLRDEGYLTIDNGATTVVSRLGAEERSLLGDWAAMKNVIAAGWDSGTSIGERLWTVLRAGGGFAESDPIRTALVGADRRAVSRALTERSRSGRISIVRLFVQRETVDQTAQSLDLSDPILHDVLRNALIGIVESLLHSTNLMAVDTTDSGADTRVADNPPPPTAGESPKALADTVFREVLRLVGADQIAHSIAAEAFARAGDHDPAALVTLARNLAVEHVRQARFRQAILSNFISSRRDASHPLVRALAGADRQKWDRGFDALEPHEREYLLLQFWEGLPDVVVADTLHLTETPSVLTVRTIRKLATFIAADRSSTSAHTNPPGGTEDASTNPVPGVLPIEDYRFLGGTAGVDMPDDVAMAIIEKALPSLASAMKGNYNLNIRVGRFMVRFAKSEGDGLDTRVELEWRVLELLAQYGVDGVPRVFKVLDGVEMPDGSRIDGVQIQGFVDNAERVADMATVPVETVVEAIRELHRQLRPIPVGSGDPAESGEPQDDPGEFIRRLVDEQMKILEDALPEFRAIFAELEVPENPFEPVIKMSWSLDPVRFRVLHTDLHFGNLLLSVVDGRITVLDWELARAGDKNYDLARLYHLEGVGPSGGVIYIFLLQIQRIIHDIIRLTRAASFGLLTPEQIRFADTKLKQAFMTARPLWGHPQGLPHRPIKVAIGVYHPPPAQWTAPTVQQATTEGRAEPTATESETVGAAFTSTRHAAPAPTTTPAARVDVPATPSTVEIAIPDLSATFTELQSWAYRVPDDQIRQLMNDLRAKITDHLTAFNRGEPQSTAEELAGTTRALNVLVVESSRRIARNAPGPVSDHASLFEVARYLVDQRPTTHEIAASANAVRDSVGAMTPHPANPTTLPQLHTMTSRLGRTAQLVERAVAAVPWTEESTLPGDSDPAETHRGPVAAAHELVASNWPWRENLFWADVIDSYLLTRSTTGFAPALIHALRSLPDQAAAFARASAGSDRDFATAAATYLSGRLEAAAYYLVNTSNYAAGLDLVRQADEALAEVATRLTSHQAAQDASNAIHELHIELAELNEDLPGYRRPEQMYRVTLDRLLTNTETQEAIEQTLTLLRRMSTPPNGGRSNDDGDDRGGGTVPRPNSKPPTSGPPSATGAVPSPTAEEVGTPRDREARPKPEAGEDISSYEPVSEPDESRATRTPTDQRQSETSQEPGDTAVANQIGIGRLAVGPGVADPPPDAAIPFHDFDLRAALDLPPVRERHRPLGHRRGFAGLDPALAFHHNPDNGREWDADDQPAAPMRPEPPSNESPIEDTQVDATADDHPADPHRWLEEITGERQLAWVREYNERTVAEFASSPEFAALEQRILEMLGNQDHVAHPDRCGDWFYEFRRDTEHPRGLWQRINAAEYRNGGAEWDVLLDLDALNEAESESWAWGQAKVLGAGQRRALISLSYGGGDSNVVREFDIRTRQFVDPEDGGFYLPLARNVFNWVDEDTVYVGTDFGPNSFTAGGWPRIAKRWRRGTPLSAAETVLEGEVDDVIVRAGDGLPPGMDPQHAVRYTDFYNHETYVLHPDGSKQLLEVPTDAEAVWRENQLLVVPKSPWAVGGHQYPAGSVLVANLDAFLAGQRDLEVLFTPDAHTVLHSPAASGIARSGYHWTGNHLLLTLMSDVQTKVEVLTPTADGWTRTPLGGIPEMTTSTVIGLDPATGGDEFLISTEGFTTPPSVLAGSVGGESRLVERAPAFFDTTDMVTEQFFATSADGTRIPYFVTRHRGATGPTIMRGYGGFRDSLTPTYDGAMGMAWLEDGGISVVANIRGGGEYGPQWHTDVLNPNRHKVFEDFAAVAADLVARGITTHAQLGAIGTSNGGLLMGVMLTRYPNLFGALVARLPLLDMQRFHLLHGGAIWTAEYGDPDNPDEAAHILSPLHDIDHTQEYPPILLRTATNDDRMHPGHARKMAALLAEQGHEVWFYETSEGGHAVADNRQAAFETALVYSFFRRKLMGGTSGRPAEDGPAGGAGAAQSPERRSMPDPPRPSDGATPRPTDQPGVTDVLDETPKIMPHEHIEGTVAPEVSWEIARRNGIELRHHGVRIDSVEAWAALHRFTDFPSFLQMWRLVTGVLRTAEDFQRIVVEYAASVKAHGVVYAEIDFSPIGRTLDGVYYDEMFEGIYAGIVEAEAQHGVIIRMTPSLVWGVTAEQAEECVRWAGGLRHRYVVGLSIGGNEMLSRETLSRYDRAFAIAREEYGLGIVPHVGEVGDSAAIAAALLRWKPVRIRHGVSLQSPGRIMTPIDKAIVARLIEQDIVLDLAITSNLLTGAVRNLDDHPLTWFVDAGVRCTISTDDPALMGTDPTKEYALAAQLGLSPAAAYWNGVQGILCDEDTRQRLIAIGEQAFPDDGEFNRPTA